MANKNETIVYIYFILFIYVIESFKRDIYIYHVYIIDKKHTGLKPQTSLNTVG
jgi:hypothetical protein